MSEPAYIDLLFKHGPTEHSVQAVEITDGEGNRVRVGEWLEQTDGRWVFRIKPPPEML